MAKFNPKKPSQYLTTESKQAQRCPRDQDNTKGVIAYMVERGAFAEYDLNELDRYTITPLGERLPWNEAAKPRIVALELSEQIRGTTEWHRGRPRYRPAHAEHRVTVRIPHWDYDGVDPLVAREPWERDDANRQLDNEAATREWKRQWPINSIEHDAHQMECCEHLNDRQGSRVFTYPAGPE